MRTVFGVLTSSIVILSDNYIVQAFFGVISFYLIYREFKSSDEMSK